MNNSSSTNDTDGYYTENECDYEITNTTAEQWIKVAACLLVLVVSLIANSFIVYIVARQRKLQTVTNCLVANMACCDLLISLINIPELIKEEVTLSTNMPTGGTLGSVLCKGMVFSQDVSSFCSILTLVAIAMDRYLAIRCPYKKIITTQNVKFVICGTWGVAILVSSPLLYANKITQDEYGFYCLEDWTPAFKDTIGSSRAYTITTFLLLYLLPLCVITGLYSGVVHRLWHRKVPGNQTTSSNERAKSKKRVLKMLVAIVLAFALCWLPYHVYFFLENYYYVKCPGPANWYFCGKFIAYANSAINPCIFIRFDRGVRRFISTKIHPCCEDMGERTDQVPGMPSRFYSSQTGAEVMTVQGIRMTMMVTGQGRGDDITNDITRSVYIACPVMQRGKDNEGFYGNSKIGGEAGPL